MPPWVGDISFLSPMKKSVLVGYITMTSQMMKIYPIISHPYGSKHLLTRSANPQIIPQTLPGRR